MKRLARFLATLGPIGFAPTAPATVASAAVALVAWFVPVAPLPALIACFIAATLIAVWAAGIAEETLGHDAGPIVIDEVIGMSISLLFVPRGIPAYILAFFLFRLFDIWKPLGAREIQSLPGGWGVVADDVMAGAIACGTYQLVALSTRPLLPALF